MELPENQEPGGFDAVQNRHRDISYDYIRVQSQGSRNESLAIPDSSRKLRQSGVKAKIVFLTLHSGDDFVQARLEAGACGYVLKYRLDTDLMPALHKVIQGRPFVLAPPAGLAN
jgi:hypothetical protein